MNLFDIAVARKLSGGGGSGSGVSTATLRLIVTAGSLALPQIEDQTIVANVYENCNTTIDVCLYNGVCFAAPSLPPDQLNILTDGNVEFDAVIGVIAITGNGALMIQSASN